MAFPSQAPRPAFASANAITSLKTLLWLVVLLALAAPTLADSGVQGRVAWRGNLTAGVRVYAYQRIEDIAAGKPVGVSAESDSQGRFRLPLSPGTYYLTARSYTGRPEVGEYFAYYNAGAVAVSVDRFASAAFNLIRIPSEKAPVAAAMTGIEGQISYLDRPLERVYLYVYRDAGDGFKGPGYNILPVEKGRFRLRLPPGDYYLVARKRARGGRFGPLETGDYFNYYYGNPVRVAAGQVREVRIETITRLSLLEEEQPLEFHGVSGRILDADGSPVSGLYVFGYRESDMTGTPKVFSAPSDAQGAFRLPLPEEGPWYLLARESFGGPAGDEELYGRFGGAKAVPLLLSDAEKSPEVTIRVEPKAAAHP